MMGSDEAMMGSDEVRGENNSSLLQSLEKEVLALRKSETSLIAELQRRCDKMIELEVHLDEERARANRLQRERTEEDEALSGELRDIMATVALDSANSLTLAAAATAAAAAAAAAGADVPSSDSAEGAGAAAKSNNGAAAPAPAPATTTAIASVAAGEPAAQDRASAGGDSPAEPSGPPAEEPAEQQPTPEPSSTSGGGGGAEAAGGAAGFFAEWRARRARGARNDSGVSVTEGGTADGNGRQAGTKAESTRTAATGEKEEGVGDVVGGELPPKDRGREQAAGALRARVVELELQRAKAEDEMREKMDRSIRLEVQVEQLKNVVQSLSHASAQDESQGWEQGKNPKRATRGNAPGTIDLDPLLRGVPGVDPHVLLLLHRSPWADGVVEGIRKEETCFEWQGRDSRGEWSSKLCNLPAELSSLPFHSMGLPTPPAPAPAPLRRPLKSPPPPSSGDIQTSVARKRAPSAVSNGDAEPGEHEGGAGGLKETIGEAVAALGAAGRGLGGSRGAPGARTVTDQGLTLRFELDNVGLPSEHWEWVGGWMVDSETEASADQDGWVYGRAAAEISEIALGRQPTSSRNIGGESYRGGDGSSSSSSSSSSPTPKQSASGGGESAAGSIEAAGAPSPPPQASEAGVEASPPQQRQQQETSLSDPHRESDPAPPAPPAGQQADAGSEALQRREKDGSKGGAGPATAARGGGGDDDGGGGEDEGAADTEGGPGRGRGGEGLWLRRRKLVRLRMVRRVDGARASTTSVLEMMRRLCSLEVLVRKLSSQVVAQQRQVTSLESQVAFLAPLHPKLKKACALGRKDRQRGNALQGRLIEAENEIKVLRRCLGATNAPRSAPRPKPRPRPVPIASSAANAAAASATANAAGRQPPKATGTLSAQELEEAGEMGESEGPREGDGEGEEGPKPTDGDGGGGGGDGDGDGDGGGGSVGAEAWGWVEGVAQRAAGTFARRNRPPPVSEAEEGAAKESAVA